jgi:hypothetical protein
VSLPLILKGVDWQANIAAAFDDKLALEKVEAALFRLSVWANQLSTVDGMNPALCFTREMQSSALNSVTLLGLCLYKASASSSRTLFESCLYYTYFRSHPEELATLVRADKFYVSKSDVIEYHRIHTNNFMIYQNVLGLIGKIDSWYSKVSAIIHGQIPGEWNAHASIAEISFDRVVRKLAIENFLASEDLAHQILLCTAGSRHWAGFSPGAKSLLLKGLSGDKREALGLDAQ